MTVNVLVIDDDEMMQELIYFSLEMYGNFMVDACHTGAEALTAVKINKPDCILLDIMLPDTSGTELIGQLQKFKTLTQVPIIFVSGMHSQNDVNDIENLKALGAAGVISKPLDIQTFPKTLIEILNQANGDSKTNSF